MIKKTLLILVFNGENFLNRALKSVYNQTIPIDEVLIIDDASNDNTQNIISKWEENLPIINIKNKTNIGIFKSLKQGVNESSGQLIFRLEHDDEWKPDHIEEILNLYFKDPNAAIYSTRAEYFDSFGNFIKSSEEVNDKNIRKKFLWDNPLVQSSTAFLKKNYLNIEQATNLYSSEDYDLWIRLIKNGPLQFSNKKTIYYYVYKNSLSRRNINRNYRERYKCQFNAIKFFYKSYPIRSFFILLILFLRIIFNLRYGRFDNLLESNK